LIDVMKKARKFTLVH